MTQRGIASGPSSGPDRAIVIVSRVFGIYPWRHRHAEDPGWFERRMQLLQRITLPALSRVQVPFVWVWQAHRTKVDLVARQMDQIDLNAIDVRVIDQRARTDGGIWPGVDKFLTFRVDTDDAWLPSALEGVATQRFDDQTLINFPRGVTLDWTSGEMMHRNLASHQGPFLAVTQDRDMMLDTGGSHREAQVGRTIHQIDTVSWVQVVHGGNAINRLPVEPSKAIYRRDGPYADGAPVGAALREQILMATGIQLTMDQQAFDVRSPS
jgi:hypothetical protein